MFECKDKKLNKTTDFSLLLDTLLLIRYMVQSEKNRMILKYMFQDVAIWRHPTFSHKYSLYIERVFCIIDSDEIKCCV